MNFDTIFRRTFDFDLIPFTELRDITTEGSRVYITPEGNEYESVTTFLGRVTDKSGLDAWRKRLGDEKANEVMRAAGERGSLVHGHLEDFLLGKEVEGSEFNYMLNYFKPHLRKNLTKVHAIEACLYSDIMKLAGRVDLVGEWKNEKAIIDFKTSTREKKEEWIESYFLQTTIYSLMVKELTGINIEKIVVLIGLENSTNIQIFERDRKDYVPKLRELLQKDFEAKNKAP